MKYSIVVPTVSGREDSLKRCVESYEHTLADTDHEIIIVLDHPNWPQACNHGYTQSSGDIVHFTADDLEALDGWHTDLEPVLEADELPAGYVWNYSDFGDPDNVADGSAGSTTWFTRVPVMTRSQWERIGAWPDLDFYCDVWVSERARAIGIETRLVGSYRFVHHWHQVKRITNNQARVSKAWAQLQQLRLDLAS